MIDFDYNATTPLKESVRRAMEPYLNGRYGNPSSIHQVGQTTRAAVEEARDSIAGTLGTDPESLVITGSGSEANTLAIRGFLNRPFEETTVVTTPVEHSSVRDTVGWLESNGATVHRIPMLKSGQIDFEAAKAMLDDSVDLVTMMTVNNETGVVFPVQEVGALCEDRGITMHTDAVQAFGKQPLDFSENPVDMLSVSAHKIGGPKGVGALVAPKGLELEPLIFGGHQERERRGGTENVPGVVGFGRAVQDLDVHQFETLREKRSVFEDVLKKELADVLIVGKETHRVANTSGVILPEVEGEDVVMRMDMNNYAVATGAACSSGSSQPSHVLRSIPLPDGYRAESFVRFSFSPQHSQNDILDGARNLLSVVKDLKSTVISTSTTGDRVTQP